MNNCFFLSQISDYHEFANLFDQPRNLLPGHFVAPGEGATQIPNCMDSKGTGTSREIAVPPTQIQATKDLGDQTFVFERPDHFIRVPTYRE